MTLVMLCERCWGRGCVPDCDGELVECPACEGGAGTVFHLDGEPAALVREILAEEPSAPMTPAT